GVHVVDRAEQLLLRVEIPGRAITTHAHADGAGTAALPLRLPHGVQNALADPFEGSVSAPEMLERRRQRVLRIHVLAAAALQEQPYLDRVPLPLFEVYDGGTRAEVVPRFGAGDGIDRIGAQLALFRRGRHGFPDLL